MAIRPFNFEILQTSNHSLFSDGHLVVVVVVPFRFIRVDRGGYEDEEEDDDLFLFCVCMYVRVHACVCMCVHSYSVC